MSKVILTQKPSVLPWYAAALVFAVLCAVLMGIGLLGCDDDLILPWESIRTIGTDVIMVDAGPLPGARRR